MDKTGKILFGACAAIIAAIIGGKVYYDQWDAARYHTIAANEVTEILASYPFRTGGQTYGVTAQGDTIEFKSDHCINTWSVDRGKVDSRMWKVDSLKVRTAHVEKQYYKNSTAFRWDE